MSTSDNCKDGLSKSNDSICEMNDMLQNISTDDKDNDTSVCANCGKEGSDVNNICNKCKMTKYCNATCKKKHKKKHKKECEEHIRLAAEKHNEELRIAAELHDEKLFKQPPPKDDCPICFLRLPTLQTGYRYQTCCGKVICNGCAHAPLFDNQGNKVDNQKCPFCRTPKPSSEKEAIKRMKERVEANDPNAIYNLAIDYRDGTCGYSQDYTKALEVYHRAADLEFTAAYSSIGYAYDNGQGVKVDEEKAKHYWELAAMGGSVQSRYNLGNNELYAGNMDSALKHYMIAVRSGDAESVEVIQEMYTDGYATKDDYMEALRSYQVYLGEIKSDQRDKAAAARDDYRYY